MIPIQAYLVASHLDDLRREAAAARLARLAREAAFAGGDSFGGSRRPRRPDVRRTLARAAVQLSRLADGAAHRLDPCLEEAFRVPGEARTSRATGVASQ
ncbi:MAG TPA: hypothetical protein VJ506_10080 [Candidatus Limnocylindrales bacterium]|nr:hypothetical protein [Candidatus Limnocylindrales bacterium]